MAASATTGPTAAAVAGFERLVLFDGVCVVCNRAARWLMARDPEALLRFATLQGETAAAVRARHPEIPEDIDTVVYVDTSGGGERVYLRSEALLRAWAAVDPASPWRRLLAALPRPLADLGYRLFARTRYRLFGRYETCPLPTPPHRERMLG
jgi:predicted DCC family thiol-disulfide oxidoreductase YuxK